MTTTPQIHRVGVIGGGQLAWMMAAAARKLELELVVQTPNATDPAVAIATQTILAAIDDAAATAELAEQCEVITFENEFVNLEALTYLELSGVCFRPALSVLEPLLDKYRQRCYLQELGLPIPGFVALEGEYPTSATLEALRAFPIVLKTRRHGYDGQGTFIVRSETELKQVLTCLGRQPLMLEEYIPFERELAIMAARSLNGEILTYPVVETQQKHQVCRWVLAPAEVESDILEQCQAIAHTLLSQKQIVGIIGIELFLAPGHKLLVNEIAPRTHNSGHFTLDACVTSQFEQQLRAISGLPLGDPSLTSSGAIMVNLLGYEHSRQTYWQQRQQLATIPNANVYWYGKAEARPGRKLGHITVKVPQIYHDARQELLAIVHQIEQTWYGSALLGTS